jgi:hypothetical protein
MVTPTSPRGRGGVHSRSGDDDTPANSWFTITIRQPKGGWPPQFLNPLATLLSNPGVVNQLVVSLPIEDAIFNAPQPPTTDQVRIDWPY